jgi:hypothetical protein
MNNIRLNRRDITSIEGSFIQQTGDNPDASSKSCSCETTQTKCDNISASSDIEPKYVVCYGYWEIAGYGNIYCRVNYGSVKAMQKKGTECYGASLLATYYWNGAGNWVQEPLNVCSIGGGVC